MSRFCVAASILVFILCGAISANAGPLPPCIRATLSANGNALVVNDLTFDDPDETHVRKIETSTFRVFRSYRDLNYGLRVNGPNKYWADPYWEVVFTRDGNPPMIACPYALVTENAQYLVLVGTNFTSTALSIYRRDDSSRVPNRGVLVRQVPSSDLFPEIKRPEISTDHTPQWFAGGTFSFSADERTLIFTMSDGKRLQISLLTGDVQH